METLYFLDSSFILKSNGIKPDECIFLNAVYARDNLAFAFQRQDNYYFFKVYLHTNVIYACNINDLSQEEINNKSVDIIKALQIYSSVIRIPKHVFRISNELYDLIEKHSILI